MADGAANRINVGLALLLLGSHKTLNVVTTVQE
jgi:hypothetical protein